MITAQEKYEAYQALDTVTLDEGAIIRINYWHLLLQVQVIEIRPDGVWFENLSNGRLIHVSYTMMDRYESETGRAFVEAVFWFTGWTGTYL